MLENRCNRNYHRLKIYACALFAAGIREAYYGHAAVFTSPPVSQADFEALLKSYNDCYTDYRNGGKGQKGAWLTAKKNMLNALDLLAANVDEVAAGNEVVIAQSGFASIKAWRTTRNSPEAPTGLGGSHGATGQIAVWCSPQGRDITYGCILTENEPLPNLLFTDNEALQLPANLPMAVRISRTPLRKKTFIGLKRLATYYVYYYACNANGTSTLSNPFSMVCL